MKRIVQNMLCLLTAAILLVLPRFSNAAGPSDSQIRTMGGTANRDGVFLSKTISGTGSENHFDITLQIETPHSLEKLTQAQDAAVVIVMDFSGTMNQHLSDDPSLPTRLDSAKAAASTFISAFCDPDKHLGADRELGFVTFCQEAQTLFPLQRATEAKRDEWVSIISDDDLTAPSSQDGGKGWTNIESGLLLAGNLLAESTAAQKFIILISDGFPTTYVAPDADRESTALIEGLNPTSGFYDHAKLRPNGTRGVECTMGTSYSETAAQKARAAAAAIKKSGVNIFSIGVQIGDETIQHHIERITWDASVVERPAAAADPGYVYEIGAANDPDSYRDWLGGLGGKGIGGGPAFVPGSTIYGEHGAYVDANDTASMTGAFETILQEVEIINEKAIHDTWIASDPMSSDVEFLNFWNADSNAAAFSQNTILWDLKSSPHTTRTEGNTTYDIYTLSYRVRLKNEQAGFLPATRADAEDEPLYLTNGSASLHYKVEENGQLSPERTLSFAQPAVEGYHGVLSFTKLTSATGGPHAGVSFQLSHEGEDCAECGGRVFVGPKTGVSGEDGRVIISGIPSGHSYSLIETGLSGYVERSHRVVVSYGSTTLYDENGQPVSSITNDLIPCTLSLSAVKRMDGQLPPADVFSFDLLAQNDKLLQRKTASADGSITFAPLTFSVPGSYVYHIREVRGTDASIRYDAAVYTVTVDVVKTDAGCAAAISSILRDGLPHQGEIQFDNRTHIPSIPKTGDDGKPFLWALLLALSGGAATFLLLMKKKS